MKTQRILKFIAITFGIISFLTSLGISIYALDLKINTSPPQSYETYSQLGSFLGGVLNPLLTIINICVFVYLTIVIQEATSKSNRESINTSKWVALLNLKFDEFKHFRQEIDRALDLWIADPKNPDRFQYFLTTYNIQGHRLSVLIPSFRDMEHNKSIRKYIIEASDMFKSSSRTEAARRSIPISNTYGMLIQDIAELITETQLSK